MRDNPTVEQILAANVTLPEKDTAREYWSPTTDQAIELAAIEDQAVRVMRGNELVLEWRQANLNENARGVRR